MTKGAVARREDEGSGASIVAKKLRSVGLGIGVLAFVRHSEDMKPADQRQSATDI